MCLALSAWAVHQGDGLHVSANVRARGERILVLDTSRRVLDSLRWLRNGLSYLVFRRVRVSLNMGAAFRLANTLTIRKKR